MSCVDSTDINTLLLSPAINAIFRRTTTSHLQVQRFERVFKCCEIKIDAQSFPNYGKTPLNKQRYLTPAHGSSCISYVYVDAEVNLSLETIAGRSFISSH